MDKIDYSEFRDWHKVDAWIDLAFMDRIRLILGSRLRIRTEIGLPWRTQMRISTSAVIDKVFGGRERKPAEDQDEPA